MKQILFFIQISTLLLIISCSNQSENKELVDQKIDGFSIPLPQNWIDKSQMDIKENLLKFDFKESEISNLLKSHNGSLPVVIFMKYDPSVFAGPIPTIQVLLRPNNNKDFAGFKKDMHKSLSEMGKFFSNFKIIEPLNILKIDGIKGIRFISQFDLSGQQEKTWTIRSWTYGFPSGKYFYQINFSDTKDENCESIYNEIINQVKFKK